LLFNTRYSLFCDAQSFRLRAEAVQTRLRQAFGDGAAAETGAPFPAGAADDGAGCDMGCVIGCVMGCVMGLASG